jgi:hypothetical protein
VVDAAEHFEDKEAGALAELVQAADQEEVVAQHLDSDIGLFY